MLSNNEIQAAWVAYLKANANIIAQVGIEEIREDNWQGREFTYPNIRVRLISNEPEAGRDCNLHSVIISTMVFSEDPFSRQADTITGIINDELHDYQFVSNNISFGVRSSNLVPALRSDANTWRAELFRA